MPRKAGSVYLVLAQRASLFILLSRIDWAQAEAIRRVGCPLCGGPLHRATYRRKPRGGPKLPERLSVRLGLCCGHCRRRVLPPSVLFLGRKVYWAAVVVLASAMRQRRAKAASASRLRELFGASWKTVRRWMRWWANDFPASRPWRAFRGQVPVSVRDDELPASLIDVLKPHGLRKFLTHWAQLEHATSAQ